MEPDPYFVHQRAALADRYEHILENIRRLVGASPDDDLEEEVARVVARARTEPAYERAA